MAKGVIHADLRLLVISPSVANSYILLALHLEWDWR